MFNMLRPHEQGSEDDLLQSVEAAGGFLLEDEEGEWDYVDENGEEEEADYDPPRHWEVARDAGFVTSAAFVAPPALPQVRSGPELFDLTTPASRMILSSPLESGHGAKTPIVHQQNPVSAPGLHLPSGSVIGENYLHQPQTYDPRLLTSMGQQRQAAPLLNRSEINERVATLGIEGPRGTESIGEAPSAETFAAQIDSPRKAFGTTNAVGKQDYGLEDDGAMRGVYTGAREGDIHDLISKDSGVSALVSMASGGKLVLPNPTLDRLRRSSLGVEPSRFNLLLQHIGKFHSLPENIYGTKVAGRCGGLFPTGLDAMVLPTRTCTGFAMSLAAPVFSREFIAGFPAMTSTSSSCNWQRERDSLCSWVRLALDVYIVPNLDGIYSCIWTQVVKPCLDRGGPSKTLRVSDMPFWSAWSTQESELDSASRFRKGFEEALRDFASGQRSSGGSSFTSGQHNVTRDGVAKLLDNLYIEPSAVITGSQFNQLRTYVRTVLKFRLKIDTVQIASSRLALEEPMVLEEVMVRRWPALLEVVSKSRRLSVEPYAYDTRLHTAALWHCVFGGDRTS